VEQCIAVDHKDLVFDGEEEPYLYADSETSSDDEDALTMKRNSHSMALRPSASRSNSNSGRRIIETLPATTLKDRVDDLPNFGEQSQHHTFGSDNSSLPNNKGLSPSASQETLRPPRSSRSNLVSSMDKKGNYADDNDDGASDDDYAWSFGPSNPRSSLGASSSRGRNNGRPSTSRSHTPAGRGHYNVEDDEYDDTFSVEGMRRTGSGMFMPYEEGEEPVATGIFGRVSETINTARDIAHVSYFPHHIITILW
jgi:hypothetical protein